MRRILVLATLSVLLGGCRTPGTISYTYQDGRWVPATAVFIRDNVDAGEVQAIAERLNGE